MKNSKCTNCAKNAVLPAHGFCTECGIPVEVSKSLIPATIKFKTEVLTKTL